jgi:hypothetical protein
MRREGHPMEDNVLEGRKKTHMQTIRLLFLIVVSAFLAAAQSDPPGRVGRLSYMSGAVSFRTGDVEDWVAADTNRPLTIGDHLWTDEGARAELYIGTAALRLNSRTAFEFLNLDDANVQIRLTEGSLIVRLRSLAEQETFEVDTPNLAFSPLRPGEYRIDVNPDNQTTTVTVQGGQGEVTGNGQAFTVRAREQARVSSGDTLSYNVVPAPPPDEWDNWALARDRRDDQSPSARYVSREMTGYQDLDDNGDWRPVADYGTVWVPRTVVAGWAPYHYGHWVWVEPWGWTWVDDAPWGFAPFHYGRWVYVGYWAWVPGPVAVRPVYAPALVAWVGGPRFSLAVSTGPGVAGVAWFPLGPREVYVPAYHASPVYVNRVNVTNTTIVNNINITNYNTTNVNYINRGAPGAVTAVPQNTFGTTRRVQDAAVPVQPQSLRSAQVINGAPVAPTRQSVLGNYSPAARVAQPPAAVESRTVVAKATPPQPAVPFAQRQQALAANPGRPLDASQVQQLRSTQSAPARTYIRPAQARGSGAGFPQPGGQAAPSGNPDRPMQVTPRDQVRPQNQLDIVRPATPQQQIQVQPPQQTIPSPRAPQTIQQQQNIPPQQNNVPPRVTQQPAPPQQQTRVPSNSTPPRQVEQPRPQNRPERPAAKEEKKDEKKDEKKKDEKKQL